MTSHVQLRLIGLGAVSLLTKGALVGPPIEQDFTPYNPMG